MLSSAIVLTVFTAAVSAQTTYTGCHNETDSGTAIEYCFGPDGVESARATYTDNLPATNPATTTTSADNSGQTGSITSCHMHETAIYCINGAGSEVLVSATPTGDAPPASYTDCHSHGEEMFCVDPEGNDVTVTAEGGDSEEAATGTSGDGQTTAVTSCHSHETAIYCINGEGSEVLVEATPTGEIPAQYTDCHAHESEMYCLDPAGEEVFVSAQASTDDSSEEHEHCHFHAGVEHCVGAGESESEGTRDCGLRTRDYDVGLRVGTLFVILVTSAIGVFIPLVLNKLPLGAWGGHALMVVKQFGTGVIISTAFIHLYIHADLMFSNECIGGLEYEGTTSAIVMAGIFLSFLVEYLGLRLVASRAAKSAGDSAAFQSQHEHTGKGSPAPSQESPRNAFSAVDHHHHGGPNNKLSVMVMEAGILFHSILIGLTLVVAGDSFYRTLLVVIVFHQFFEGMALGARIALLPGAIFPWKFVMAIAFTLITPIGMAIGIGVLNSFNGNDPNTVITFGTLDALSAGILVWVGVVDMWARDWVIEGGELLDSGIFKTLGGGVSLICGMILMGVLGKWA